MEIKFDFEGPVQIKINGQPLHVHPGKMHPTFLARCLEYGIRRHVNDANASLKEDVKLEACTALVAEMNAGKEYVVARQVGSGVVKADPVRKMAREMATDFLTQQLAAKFGKDMNVWAKEEKLAKLFRFTDKGAARFDLEEVDAWMKGFAAKRDFMAEAKAEIERRANAAKVDLDDLGL